MRKSLWIFLSNQGEYGLIKDETYEIFSRKKRKTYLYILKYVIFLATVDMLQILVKVFYSIFRAHLNITKNYSVAKKATIHHMPWLHQDLSS